MSDKTHIEWTDATWNPVTGCSKVSKGCKHCYAERDWARLAANPATRYHGRDFTDVRCHEDVLDLPLRWKKPRKVFVNSMSDLFHEAVPFEIIDRVFATMARAKHHTFQVLTKRPDRMFTYLARQNPAPRISDVIDPEWRDGRRGEPIVTLPLPNVWLGVSVEDQATADERIPILLNTPAALRWISAEPLLGPIDLAAIKIAGGCASECCGNWRYDVLSGFTFCGDAPENAEPMYELNWVVVGGESGPHARPMHPNWVRSLRDQCAVSDVPFLFKQWGEWVPRSDCYHTFVDGKSCADRDPGGTSSPIIRLTYQGGNGHDLSSDHGGGDDVYMQRVGRNAAGRLLEGVEHNGYPV